MPVPVIIASGISTPASLNATEDATTPILTPVDMRLIKAGFIVLTISLFTGLIFVSDLFGQHLGHKTLLSIFAWLIFALVLWGRWKRGWPRLRNA